jgi:hypothetical protein
MPTFSNMGAQYGSTCGSLQRTLYEFPLTGLCGQDRARLFFVAFIFGPTLATSTTQTGASMIIGKNGLNVWNSFNVVVTGDDVERAKPDPEIYNRVLLELGDALAYLVFEDSLSGVTSAKLAGMSCIAVPNRFTASQNFAMADLVITSLDNKAARRPTSPNPQTANAQQCSRLSGLLRHRAVSRRGD